MLKPQIKAIERNVPWTYIYFVSKDSKNVQKLSENVFDKTARAVGESLKARYQELFEA